MDIVKEIYKLRLDLVKAINNNPLPATVKLMIVAETMTALKIAETKEIREASAKKEVEKENG